MYVKIHVLLTPFPYTASLQLSERIEVSSENAQRLEKDLLELTSAKAQLEEELASSEGKLKASLADIETNRQQLNTNEQNFEQLNSEMKTQSENYQRELLEITRIKEKLESSLEKEIKQRTELEAHNEQLTASSQEKQRETDDVREMLKSKDEAIENLTHDMEVTRTSHLNQEAQLTTANDHIQAPSTQMGAMEEAHKSEVERLEIETRERLDQLGSAGEEIGRLQVSC